MKEKETSNSHFVIDILTNLLVGGFWFLILKNTFLMELPMQYFNDSSMSLYWKLPMGFFLFLFLSYSSEFVIEIIIKLFKKDSTLENLERERAREAYEEEQRQEEARQAEEERQERQRKESKRQAEEERQERQRKESKRQAEEERQRKESKRQAEEQKAKEEKRKEEEKFKSHTYNKSSESIFNENTMNLISLIKKSNSFYEIYDNYNEKNTTNKKKLQQIFRKIIVKIHPDKSASLGISQKILNEITQKFQNLYSQVK